ncbi:MAG: molecular chaperone DnaJ [Parvularculales bacterium]
MAKRDFYEVLNVDRTASQNDLKKAYRTLAKKYHPDRNANNPEAEKHFKEINEAYDILKDDQARAAYDQFGHAAFEGGGRPGQSGFQSGGFGAGTSNFPDFSSVFEDLFGGIGGGHQSPRGRRGGQHRRGNDLQFDMTISLEDAARGKEAHIKVPTAVACDACGGKGAAPGTEPVSCPTCGGAGVTHASQGFFTIERTCPHCQGGGQIIKSPCIQCHGRGRVSRTRELSVKIPAGVRDGNRIRMAGEGEAGPQGGTAGDLYIFLSVRPHDLFQRDGDNLFCDMPITMTTAALGGDIEVPTLINGKVRLRIPAGSQTGRRFRLKGQGMPIMRSSAHGDLYVRVTVETPVNLSDSQRALLQEFAESAGEKTHPESHGFLHRVKEFFDGIGE